MYPSIEVTLLVRFSIKACGSYLTQDNDTIHKQELVFMYTNQWIKGSIIYTQLMKHVVFNVKCKPA